MQLNIAHAAKYSGTHGYGKNRLNLPPLGNFKPFYLTARPLTQHFMSTILSIAKFHRD